MRRPSAITTPHDLENISRFNSILKENRSAQTLTTTSSRNHESSDRLRTSATFTSSTSSPKLRQTIIAVSESGSYDISSTDGHLELFGIQDPSSYLYTSKSKCLDVNGMDDHA